MRVMENLLHDMLAFCERVQMSRTKLGLLALNDKAFVSQIEKGRRVWPETEARVRSFMAQYQQEHPK